MDLDFSIEQKVKIDTRDYVNENVKAAAEKTGAVVSSIQTFAPIIVSAFPMLAPFLISFLFAINYFKLLLFYPVKFPANYKGILTFLTSKQKFFLQPMIEKAATMKNQQFRDIYLLDTKNEWLFLSRIYLYTIGAKFFMITLSQFLMLFYAIKGKKIFRYYQKIKEKTTKQKIMYILHQRLFSMVFFVIQIDFFGMMIDNLQIYKYSQKS